MGVDTDARNQNDVKPIHQAGAQSCVHTILAVILSRSLGNEYHDLNLEPFVNSAVTTPLYCRYLPCLL